MAVSVIYLEQQPGDPETLVLGWKELFRLVGVDASISVVEDRDQVMRAAEALHCDVFICDLTLNRDDDNSLQGAKLLGEFKMLFPHIFTIGTTNGRPALNFLESLETSFDMFVHKRVIRTKAFRAPDYVRRLRERWRQLPDMRVSVPSRIEAPSEEPGPSPEQIRLLVRQLFAGPPPLSREVRPAAVRLEQLSGGRSKSAVFSLHAEHGPSGRRFIPAIVKISPIADHLEEQRRYHELIKWSLPYTARVDMLAEARGRDWGAIAYSFAHGGSSFDTLTALLGAKELDKARAAIDTLFEQAGSFWSPVDAGIEGLSDRYFARYCDSDASKFDQTEEAMLRAARDAGLDVNLGKNYLEVNHQKFTSPARQLTEYDRRQFRNSLCHGDLNTNNVIVSRSGQIALIDFRDAAIGHVFEDIITLEGCVRLFWGENEASPREGAAAFFDELVAIERSLQTDAPKGTSRSWELIRHIRVRAFDTFAEPAATYYFGLAYYCFRLLRLRPHRPVATLRLLACMLVSLEQLKAAPQ